MTPMHRRAPEPISTGHTPGPWEIREASPYWEIFGEDRSRWVAYAPKAVSDDCRAGTFYPSLSETDSNARLIAAAPELLSHLQFAVKLFSALPGFNGAAQVDAMRAAIAKATGEA